MFGNGGEVIFQGEFLWVFIVDGVIWGDVEVFEYFVVLGLEINDDYQLMLN